jgi:hypothetical protein
VRTCSSGQFVYSFCPRQIRNRWTSVQGLTRSGQPGRARCGRRSIGSTGFSTRPLPRTCDTRCPGRADRGNPAPLTSNREGAAPDWPQKPMRPLIAQQPGWSLLPKRRLHSLNAGSEGNLGKAARGSLDPGSCSRIALDCNARKIVSRGARRKPARRAALPIAGSSASRNHGLWRDSGKGWLGASTAERLVLLRATRDKRGQKQVHAPSRGRKRRRRGCAARKDPRSRVLTGSGRACSPGDQGHAWAGRSPGCVVKRSLDRRESEIERSAGCSCSWSVADVDKTHLSSGARPAERQAANHGVTFCGGLLGDDEGPIRSGQKGASLERANRLVSAREPAITAR